VVGRPSGIIVHRSDTRSSVLISYSLLFYDWLIIQVNVTHFSVYLYLVPFVYSSLNGTFDADSYSTGYREKKARLQKQPGDPKIKKSTVTI